MGLAYNSNLKGLLYGLCFGLFFLIFNIPSGLITRYRKERAEKELRDYYRKKDQ